MPKSKPKPDFGYIAEALRPLALPIATLILDPANARKHDRANLGAIKASLRSFGQVKPVVVRRETGVVVCGNGTLAAALELGWTHLAVNSVSLTESQAAALSIADNRAAELAQWDQSLLDATLAGMTVDDADLQAMLDGLKTVEISFPEAPASVQENVAQMKQMKSDRRSGNEAVQNKNDIEKYLIVVFGSREEKEAELARLGLSHDERYVSGLLFEIRAKGPARSVTNAKAAHPKKSGACG